MHLLRFFSGPQLALPRLLPLLFIALFISFVYYPSLGVPFLFDDFHNISQNPAVQPVEARDFLKVFQSEASRSRPLALLSFAINFWFHGLDVVGYHYVNIAIHIANAILLYFLLLRLLPGWSADPPEIEARPRRTLAFLATLLWAINPVQSQAVTYIVQRMTSLASFFYLAALLLFCRYRQNGMSAPWTFALIILCFGLGLASKEMVATLPAALLLLDFCFFNKRLVRKKWLLVGLSSAAILLLGWFYLGDRLLPNWQATYPNRNFSPWQRLMTEWRVVWHYLVVFVMPHPSQLQLTYDPLVSKGPLTPWTTLAGLLGIFAALVGAWLLRRRAPLLCMAIGFYFLALAVESSYLNLELAFIHRIYLPTVLLPAALLSVVSGRFQRQVGLACLLLIGLWGYWTVARNVEWQHPERFWQLEVERGGGRARAVNNQARWLMDRQGDDPKRAIELMEEALGGAKTKEARIPLLYNLAIAQKRAGKPDTALLIWKQLLDEFGVVEEAMLHIGQIYLEQQKIDQVERIILRLLNNNKTTYQAIILQANLARQQGNPQRAATLLENALKQKRPIQEQVMLRDTLARSYADLKRYNDAYKQMQIITILNPDIDAAWRSLASMLKNAGDYKRSALIERYLAARHPTAIMSAPPGGEK